MRIKEHSDDGKKGVGCNRACMGQPPPNPMGGDIGAKPRQRTGAAGKGDFTQPDNILAQRGASNKMWDKKSLVADAMLCIFST